MSSGAKVVAAFIRETTPGITPTAGAWNLLRRSSFGLKPTQNTNDNDEIAGDRMAQGVSRGTVDVGGDVGTRFRWNQHDDFLASCFGSEWLNNVLTMGNGRITFSVATLPVMWGSPILPAVARLAPSRWKSRPMVISLQPLRLQGWTGRRRVTIPAISPRQWI